MTGKEKGGGGTTKREPSHEKPIARQRPKPKARTRKERKSLKNRTYLHSHNNVRGFMQDLLDGAVVPAAELFVELELAHGDGEGGAVGEIDA